MAVSRGYAVDRGFVRAVRGLSRFRGDASARTWLLTVTRHACTDELRKRRRRRRRDALLGALGLDGETLSPDASHTSTVDDLLARLEPERRAAFVLTQQLGLSYDEAAAICECPAGTCRLAGVSGPHRSHRPAR